MELKRASIAALGMLLTVFAHGKDFSPAVLYDHAGKFDHSFNQAAHRGAERFKQEYKINYREGQIASDAQKEQLLRNMARKQADLIVAVGFAFTEAVEKVAKEYPNVRFTLIDAVAKGPNVQSILFKEQDGAFLVGIAAARATKTQRVGFIGGIGIPLIQAFGCGYAQGVKYANGQVSVIQNIVGNTPHAFNDPARGTELAKSQFDRGVDVIFVAAGATGLSVLKAANAAHRLSIGVDSNQNDLYPGSVLTSLVKRVDNIVYNAFLTAKNGTWKPGVQVLGLKENAIDWALDKHNRALISTKLENEINAAKRAIIDGKLKVIDYRTNQQKCPV